MTTPDVLLIGGMDSSGGAGLLRDALAAQAFGIATRAAVTAVTAQTDSRVWAVHPVPALVLAAQIRAADHPPAAIKIGMLCNTANVAAVADALADTLPDAPLVLDPVIRSSSGTALLDDAGLALLLDRLLPRCTLLTPNLPELALIAGALGLPRAPEPDVTSALHQRGCHAVLVKGGHAAEATCEDRLYLPAAPVAKFRAPRLPVALRGTGCQLASGVAANLALGEDLPAAVAASHALLQQRFAQAMA